MSERLKAEFDVAELHELLNEVSKWSLETEKIIQIDAVKLKKAGGTFWNCVVTFHYLSTEKLP